MDGDDSYTIIQKHLCLSMIYLKTLKMIKENVCDVYIFTTIKDEWILIVLKYRRQLVLELKITLIQ